MTTERRETTLPDLLRALPREISNLFRKEVELAKAEAADKASQVTSGVEYMLAGAILALGALGVLLAALTSGIAAMLIEWADMAQTSAESLAALIVGLIIGIVAYVLIKKGADAMKARNLALERTVESVKRDANIVRERM
jgi:uncharacterized membrane protein